MRHFFAAGGRMIDSSPMYGSAQDVIGEGWRRLGKSARLFAADKVWTGAGASGPAQIETARRLWGVPSFDLLQVHNLLVWQENLPTLFKMKAAGRLRHVGITGAKLNCSAWRRIRPHSQRSGCKASALLCFVPCIRPISPH
ncbi:MAG: aldo/keto reductase [Telluria sp.]